MKRVPRPTGFTHLAHSQKENKPLLTQRIIQEYVQNDFTLFGNRLSISELSTFLNVPVARILKATNKLLTHMLELHGDQGDLQAHLARLQQLSLKWALDDRSYVVNQLQKLIVSQGDGYKPFVTQGVNQALKLLLDSQNTMHSLMRTIQPAAGTQINIQNNQTNNDYITPEQALNMLTPEQDTSEQAKLHNADMEAIEAEVYKGDLPEIDPRKQSGYRAGGERLVKSPKSEDLEILDN